MNQSGKARRELFITLVKCYEKDFTICWNLLLHWSSQSISICSSLSKWVEEEEEEDDDDDNDNEMKKMKRADQNGEEDEQDDDG